MWILGGTANYPGNVVLAASVALLHSLGPALIAEHVHRLGAILQIGVARELLIIWLTTDGQHYSMNDFVVEARQAFAGRSDVR